jgi:large subunit ribosomal protein L18
MVKHKTTYCMPLRRRREGKTDYRQRKALLKSGKKRLAIRLSSTHAAFQFIEAHLGGDRIITSATSRELTKSFGWKAACSNLPATYLTGFLAGLKAKKMGVENALLDVGVRKPQGGSRLYAGLKGVLDAGVEIPSGQNIFPPEDRIKGEHIESYWKTIGDEKEQNRRFSQYLKTGLTPEKLSEHFEEVKGKIEKAFT